MIKQYPHTIQVTIPGASTQDGNGNWVQGTAISFEGPGRFEVANLRNSSIITLADGRQIQASGVIYVPVSFPKVELESEIVILEGAAVIAKGKAIRYSKGQLNARVWL